MCKIQNANERRANWIRHHQAVKTRFLDPKFSQHYITKTKFLYPSFRFFGLQCGRRRDDGEKEGVDTLRGAEKARQALHRTGGERWVHIRRLHGN